MSLMAVCDHKKMFIKIKVGHPGSQNDTHIFTTSYFYNDMIHNPQALFPDLRSYIVGDSAYPILKHCMIPYSHSTTVRREKHFNKHLYVLTTERMYIDDSQYEEPTMYGFARTNNMDGTTLDIVNNDNNNNDNSDNDDDDATITPVLSTRSRARLSTEGKLRRDEEKDSLYIVS
ncbi:hypothetical protein PHYBLDRAFT_138383 [Phycomyces blakesleeanus NRRL 1555(-)]|uniref:DDE Tnp4 domain-containing protein n=1 Tax=Phycomyces blakesleeanus (strain ATCC 8743b / DSM 1359 / FGSC 10004 / NBRC 33097 / NRRL 1555) TaxID=763407 RepID=A0A162V8F3_PHYB8|nr:hypothetical protein PHYBLDRAFT_138383 [Phycomyces blakesleeanus NRRL 1555(-)]OAD80833.1 hypothetical protein PHYBLDRAFT_138383 [Phycomyces blakesleeanus NRRL 1555(-)]|eukprot:XP_018298873.1 hypothetical protein PHYBLDRAFT_138383 [Phycomyces blakesleeanus NRRL 1555(-)]